jgi:hypothetical protein
MNVNWRIGFFIQLLYVQQKELLQQVKISQILSFFLSLSLSLCDMNVNRRIGFFIQLLYVQQKELLHGFFVQLLYVNSSCAVFLYASAQSAMWENMSDCIGAHFRSMKIQSAIFILFF